MPALRRAIVVGSVGFAGLRDVVSELLSVRTFVREYVRHTGPHPIKSAREKVRPVYFFVEDMRSVFLLSC